MKMSWTNDSRIGYVIFGTHALTTTLFLTTCNALLCVSLRAFRTSLLKGPLLINMLRECIDQPNSNCVLCPTKNEAEPSEIFSVIQSGPQLILAKRVYTYMSTSRKCTLCILSHHFCFARKLLGGYFKHITWSPFLVGMTYCFVCRAHFMIK